eukprot:3461764-Amphidinium_carterae.1
MGIFHQVYDSSDVEPHQSRAQPFKRGIYRFEIDLQKVVCLASFQYATSQEKGSNLKTKWNKSCAGHRAGVSISQSPYPQI